MEPISDFGKERLDPLQLPVLQRGARRIAGDRRPGYRYCACCGAALDGGTVRRGIWAYCSIECALRIGESDAS